MTGTLLEGEMIVEDRTGGFTEFGSGFEKLRENLAAQRTLSGTISPAIGNIQPGISVDALTEAFLKSIEVVLLATDIRRSSLYDSIATALIQRISNEADTTFVRSLGDDDIYAGPEPKERLQDAARLFRFIHSTPQTSQNEYMDEDEPT